MFSECHYNFNTDVGEVQQFGYVLLSDALVNHQVPSDIDIQEQSFNEIPLDEYAGRPSDIFDCMEYASAVDEYINVNNQGSNNGPSHGVTQAEGAAANANN